MFPNSDNLKYDIYLIIIMAEKFILIVCNLFFNLNFIIIVRTNSLVGEGGSCVRIKIRLKKYILKSWNLIKNFSFKNKNINLQNFFNLISIHYLFKRPRDL